VATRASAFSDALALIQKMQSGAVKVLLVYGANPLYALPKEAGFADALKKVETVVSFSPLLNETAAYAHMILPERTYLEGWGYAVVSPALGKPIVSSQQPVVTPFYESETTGPAYSTGDVILTVARGIPEAIAAMPWDDEVSYLKEMVTAMPPGAFGGQGTDARWVRYLQHGGWWEAGEAEPATPTADVSAPIEVNAARFEGDAGEYPYYLHLYTPVMLGDGRGASLPWLQGAPDPMTTVTWQSWVEVNPKTAEELGLEDGDVVKITTPFGGEIEVPVYTYPAIRPDTIAIPTGQGHADAGRYAKDRGVNAVDLLGATLDVTGEHLAWSNVRVKIEATGEKMTLPLFEDKLGAQEDLHL
jgi:anaerobic selenocysteine-containing dehydrogenase